MTQNRTNLPSVQNTGIAIAVDQSLLRQIVTAVVQELATEVDWPAGRITLTEAEAAMAMGVPRHVLRDFRLAGRVSATRVGRKIVYTRAQLLAGLEAAGGERVRE